MTPDVANRLFGYHQAFDHDVTIWLIGLVVLILLVGLIVLLGLSAADRLSPASRDELFKRLASWVILTPIIILPILLGAFWTMFAVALLGLLCYREYARVTGLFREKLISLTVVAGIAAVWFAVLDHWYGLFVALGPLTVAIIVSIGILSDRPKGYIQRVALGIVGFLLFGICLGHLGFFTNSADYRPILLMLILAVELNDVFAYLTGKSFGRRKLCPNTSPNKTVGGAIGALILTTVFVAIVGHFVFVNSPMDHAALLIGLGLIVSAAGQLGDLMISSIKRDVGIKDIGNLLPGHGGLLDRFDSLLLVAPAAFHYIAYVLGGIGVDQPTQIISGP